MNFPFDIRPNNIIEYVGPLGHFTFARVHSIDIVNDNNQLFAIEHPYNDGEIFAGYSEHIRPILLNEGHLASLGFNFNPDSRQHTFGNIAITSYGYSEGDDPMNLTYVNLGFRILPDGFSSVPTLQQVKEDTIECFYLHSLQNYCTDNNIDEIDFSLIK